MQFLWESRISIVNSQNSQMFASDLNVYVKLYAWTYTMHC